VAYGSLCKLNNMLKEIYGISRNLIYEELPANWSSLTYYMGPKIPTKHQVWAEKIRQASVARVKPPPAGSSWVDWT
jgi:hypothetical protein